MKTLPNWYAVGLVVVLLGVQGLFYNAAFGSGGFADYHRYGKYDDSTAWLSKLGTTELRFYVWYCAAGTILVLGLLVLLRATRLHVWITRLSTLVTTIQESWLLVILFASSIIFVLITTTLTHKGLPLTDDEWVYRFQAEVLAQGRLTGQLHGPPEFFKNQYLVVTDKLYCQYAFGHSALLAPGVWAGSFLAPLLLLGGLTTIMVYKIGSYRTNRGSGLCAAGLVLFSPAFLLTQGTTAAQSSIITALSAFFYLMLRAVSERSSRLGLMAGLLCGMAVQIRPIDTLIVAGASAGLFIGCYKDWSDRRVWKTAGAVIVGGLITGGLYLLTNWQVNGGPFTTNYNPLWKDHASGATSAFGFGQYPWGIVHTPSKGLLHAVGNAIRLNFWSLGWPLSWLPILAGLVVGRDLWLRLALGMMIGTPFILYIFYFWPGMCDTGPAYYHFLLPIMVYAASRGLETLRTCRYRPLRRVFSRPGLVVLATGYVSVVLFLPIQAFALQRVTAVIQEPYEYLAKHVTDKALVFTPFYFFLTVTTHHGLAVELTTPLIGLRNNHPDLSDQIVLVRDLKDRNHELINKFPARTPYRFIRRGKGSYELTRLQPTGAEPLREQPKQPKLLQLQ